MKRREFITLLGGAAVWPLVARAQQPAKVRQFGILEHGARQQRMRTTMNALRQGLAGVWAMAKIGIMFLIIVRLMAMRTGFPRLLRNLVRLRVDLIVTRGTPAARAAKNATETIPIVLWLPWRAARRWRRRQSRAARW